MLDVGHLDGPATEQLVGEHVQRGRFVDRLDGVAPEQLIPQAIRLSMYFITTAF